ncbi:MAG: flagellar hook assembly protein FlgD [Pseudomonadota bacterium]
MTVSSATATTAATGSHGSNSALSSFSSNFDNFLTLLTKQLQYQDPLSPLDTNQFTQQLVQFTSVEQQIQTNQKLDQLLTLQSDNQAMAALSFLNNVVEAASDRAVLQNGRAEITYDLSGDAATASLIITDENGNPVRTIPAETAAGAHDYVWDGTDGSGNQLPDGVYGVELRAVDGDNALVAATTGIRGKVEGVQKIDGEFNLSIGALQIPLSKVSAVRTPSTTSQI